MPASAIDQDGRPRHDDRRVHAATRVGLTALAVTLLLAAAYEFSTGTPAAWGVLAGCIIFGFGAFDIGRAS